jgi:hypothetical protein
MMGTSYLFIAVFWGVFTLMTTISTQEDRVAVDRNFLHTSFRLSGDVNARIQQTDDSVFVNKIMDKLFSFPEIKRKQAFVDSLSHHKRGISMIVMQKPGKANKYYWIAVGYNGAQRFETYYNFYVWPSQMEIKYLDTESGNLLTLAQWRKLQNKH